MPAAKLCILDNVCYFFLSHIIKLLPVLKNILHQQILKQKILTTLNLRITTIMIDLS